MTGTCPKIQHPMGHEFLGLVEETCSEVRTLKPGDVVVAPNPHPGCEGEATARLAGSHELHHGAPPSSRGESHPPALTEPCVTVSRYTALVVLIIRPVRRSETERGASARTCEGIAWGA
ncbi:alcohol dehydrogenase catalytic domain-containing protein [Streptomyces sp. SD15]